jgi:tRNA modification GTPase
VLKDTIAAISTPMGEGGIAIIRVSGEESVSLVDRIFSAGERLASAQSHTVQYGYIVDPNSGERMDEVLVTVMRAPRSFTMEDVVEIGCHGGLIVVKKVLNLVLQTGIRLAEPGEFTKRAFLNGRIDLSQAEAIIDLIRAKTDLAQRVAFRQIEGKLSQEIGSIRALLLELMAHIEVNIDYPEHDVEELTGALIREKCGFGINSIDQLLQTAQQGKILREGIVTAIVGRPNVGKSSLLNALAQEDRAIVTEIAGTTRDVIEEYVQVHGIPLRLLDTAGLRETEDLVEQIGVEKSRTVLAEADLILWMMNANEPLHNDELLLLEELQGRQVIAIYNKVDLPFCKDTSPIDAVIPLERIIKMSLATGEGIDKLGNAIRSMFFEGRLQSEDLTYVSNVRHIRLLNMARSSLIDAIEASRMQIPIDILQIDVRNAWEQLGEILGDTAGESLLDQIFSQFCLGK